jgi:hypothetical protein
MGVLIVLVLLVLAGWVLFTQFGARQQITVSTEHDLASARRIVSESFGVTWTRVKGRGDENFRPKLRMHAPVLSVDYGTDESGKSTVHIWCSDYKTKVGAMAHAQLMWRKKRAVARALCPPVPVSPVPVSPVPASLPQAQGLEVPAGRGARAEGSYSPQPAPVQFNPSGPERAIGRHAHAANRSTARSTVESILPADIVRRMDFYGRVEFSPQQSGPDAANRVNDLIYQPLYPIASANPNEFIGELAAAVLPVGGWAVYGGERCVRDLINTQTRHPGFVAMIDAAMAFLRSQGYGTSYVAPYELAIWRELHPGERW